MESKVDRILDVVTVMQTDVATLKTDVATLKTDVATLKTDVATLKTDVATLALRVSSLERRSDEMLAGFKASWQDLSGLYRAVRDDLKRFEARVESKLSDVAMSIQALRDSLERQDFRADELGRRITRLEVGEEPSF